MTRTSLFPTGTILGYPRIGPRRQLKKAVEAFWAGTTTAAELEDTAATLRQATRERLVSLGLRADDSSIPGSFSFYDQMLDALCTVGAVPTRYASLVGSDGRVDLAGYFTLARGEGEHLPLEMTKWFDTNYHYLVPEIGPETAFSLSSDRIVREFTEAKAAGYLTRPVIVGPVTFLLLSKASDEADAGFSPLDRLDDLLPVYAELLGRLADAGVEWVQLDEPALVSESVDAPRQNALAALEQAYAILGALGNRPAVFVAAPYGSLDDALPVLARSAVDAIGLDLVRGSVPPKTPGLAGKTLVAGVIDGHNIWRGDLAGAFDAAQRLSELSARVTVSTSTSLLHVPHNVEDETSLDAHLVGWLAFADQKVGQVASLARGLTDGRTSIAADLAAAAEALHARRSAPGVRDGTVRARAAALTEDDYSRGDYQARLGAQEAALDLLITRLEARQVFVSRSAQHHMPQEMPPHAKFSGMTIKDNKVPFIFLATGNEGEHLEPSGRRLFTLVLLTVLIAEGTFAPVNYDGHTKDETSPRAYQLTEEVLMPAAEMRAMDFPHLQSVKDAADELKVTPSAVAMRARRLGRLDRHTFSDYMDELQDEYNNQPTQIMSSAKPVNALKKYNGVECSRRMLGILDSGHMNKTEFRRIVLCNKLPASQINDFRAAVG